MLERPASRNVADFVVFQHGFELAGSDLLLDEIVWEPQVFVISLNFDTWFVKSRGYNAGRTIGLADRAMRG